MDNNKKEQLQHLIDTINPKQLSTVVKHKPELYNEIVNEHGSTLAEKIYNTLTPGNHICQYGSNRKFKTLAEGYGNCGQARACRCTREIVSQKVSADKQSYSEDKKQEINAKRVNTTMGKYGVTNNGQTKVAKTRHAEFYQDEEKVAEAVAKGAQTKLEKYDDPNYNNPDQIKDTWNQMRDDGYWSERFPDKNLKAIHTKTILAELYTTMTIFDIAIYCNVHPNTVYRFLNIHKLRSPFSSVYEQELIIFLNNLGITNIITNKRRLISIKKEIDIFLPDYNLAIEYNGVYWHHDKISYIDHAYHYNKFKSCEDGNIELLTIFSNEWDSKKLIIKNLIIDKLQLRSNIQASQCQLQAVSSQDSKEFLEKNHVQGYEPATCSYGLYYQNNVVALMTFNIKDNNQYELIRYASNLNIIDGAKTLLSYFIDQFKPSKIHACSLNEWGTGDLYRSLGFEITSEIAPTYWYFNPTTKVPVSYAEIEHQMQHNLNMTEFQITDQMGLLRIWDCGKRSWVLNLFTS